MRPSWRRQGKHQRASRPRRCWRCRRPSPRTAAAVGSKACCALSLLLLVLLLFLLGGHPQRVEDRPRKQPVEPRLGLGAVLGPDEHVDGLEVRDAAQELLDQHGADVTRPSREEDRGAGEGGGERWLRCFFCFLEREREKKKRETLANERGQKREREGEEGRRLEKELSKNTTGTARGRDAGEPGACGFFFSSLLFIRSSAVLAPPRRARKFRFCRTERCFVTIRSIDCK